MKVLALELSSAVGSIAFRRDDGPLVVRQFPADRQHSGLFFENLSEIRRECGLPDKIVVGLGPGSYAGTRIAISTAIGLRAASSAQLVGLPSICAINLPAYCAIGDARRSSYFFAQVRQGICEEGPLLVTEEEVRQKLDAQGALPLVASEQLPQFAGVTLAYPAADVLAALGETAEPGDEMLEPIYLRPPYITTPKKPLWTR
ncbi:MAG: tRNA (adenosine(37)-N6)-threonylcarbamoyltransferase complex dimerization subunit type 1 TsaB [Chthoniobacterales bacterium]